MLEIVLIFAASFVVGFIVGHYLAHRLAATTQPAPHRRGDRTVTLGPAPLAEEHL